MPGAGWALPWACPWVEASGWTRGKRQPREQVPRAGAQSVSLESKCLPGRQVQGAERGSLPKEGLACTPKTKGREPQMCCRSPGVSPPRGVHLTPSCTGSRGFLADPRREGSREATTMVLKAPDRLEMENSVLILRWGLRGLPPWWRGERGGHGGTGHLGAGAWDQGQETAGLELFPSGGPSF